MTLFTSQTLITYCVYKQTKDTCDFVVVQNISRNDDVILEIHLALCRYATQRQLSHRFTHYDKYSLAVV